MELKEQNVYELIAMYSDVVKELKIRGILRTNNVVGEIGEFFVIEKYNANKSLPTLSSLPVGTKNINATDRNGARYSIKSTTGTSTGVFYGLEAPGSEVIDKPIFEFVVICKLNENYELEGIYQLDWAGFLKHRKWHSRMRAWNLTLTESLKQDSVIVYEKEKKKPVKGDPPIKSENVRKDSNAPQAGKIVQPVVWSEASPINHTQIRDETARRISEQIGEVFTKDSQSRYVTRNRQKALYIMSSKFSEKNKEYWYSIDAENVPWMELFSECFVAFALGSADHVLVFRYGELKTMLEGCLMTKEDQTKNKRAHYHIAFAVEGKKVVYFKRKLPRREYVNVADSLLENWK